MFPHRYALSFLVLLVLLAGCGTAQTQADSPLGKGRQVYANICSACHGATGQGGVGPALANVTATFPSCSDQVEWITLGSEAWKDRYGDTYGANDSPITAVMPGQGGTLSEDEIRSVATFERTRYGGADESATLQDCGLVGSPDS